MYRLNYRRSFIRETLTTISIHHMYRLNEKQKNSLDAIQISIHHMYRLNGIYESAKKTLNYFNTSHVSVEQDMDALGAQIDRHFNTSHVSVEPNHLQRF